MVYCIQDYTVYLTEGVEKHEGEFTENWCQGDTAEAFCQSTEKWAALCVALIAETGRNPRLHELATHALMMASQTEKPYKRALSVFVGVE